METITYRKPNGEWGIEGVDLSTLPPPVYRALHKLMALEHPMPIPVTLYLDPQMRRFPWTDDLMRRLGVFGDVH